MERVTLRHCSDADRDHQQSARAYAHVGHRVGVICLANAIVFLPREFILGILLHELGHLTGADSQADADRAGGDLAGVRILRRTHRGHGVAHKLEYVRPSDVPRAMRTIKRLTNLSEIL